MKALVVSDVVTPLIYSPQIRNRFAHVALVFSCGDLPYYYQEYIVSLLDVPLYFVRGNHDKETEFGSEGSRSAPGGGIDLHRRVINESGLLIAGVEGCLRYRDGPFQYSQSQMWGHVRRMIPKLVWNKLVHGRYLDIFVTHAPPLGIHDQDDLTHRGIEAFRWFIKVFKPAVHLHGHIHVIMPNTITVTNVDKTCVINGYGFREIDLDMLVKRM